MLHHPLLLLIGYCRDLVCWPAFLIDFILFYLPGADAAAESELLCLSSPVDLLCGPVPSCLPSPQLHPDPVVVQQADLIHFEERTPPLPTGAPSDLYSFCGIKLKGSVLFAPFPSVVKCELVCVVWTCGGPGRRHSWSTCKAWWQHRWLCRPQRTTTTSHKDPPVHGQSQQKSFT